MPTLEEALLAWFQRVRASKIQITGPLLRQQAKRIALELILKPEVSDGERAALKKFNASQGFQHKFCQRHNISQFVESGEADSVSVEAASKGRVEVQKIVVEGKYALDDIYNADETGLFYQMPPSHTLAQQDENVKGVKKKKDRVTIMVCCNAKGTDKRQLMVIGKSKSPRCFKGINLRHLHCDYRNTNKAWMSVELFNEFLRRLNDDMAKKKRNILLLVDNAPVHIVASKYPHVTVHFLEPNTTSVTQPCDAGIIRALKAHYRVKLLTFFLDCMKDGNKQNVTMLQVMKWAEKAWEEITQATIQNCWRHTGILPSNTTSSTSTLPTAAEDALAQLVAEMKIEDNMDVNEYIDIDKDVTTHETEINVDINELIQNIIDDKKERTEESKEDEASDEEISPVNPSQARTCLDTLRNFCLQQDSTTEEQLRTLRQFEDFICTQELKQRKQTRIDHFFQVAQPNVHMNDNIHISE